MARAIGHQLAVRTGQLPTESDRGDCPEPTIFQRLLSCTRSSEFPVIRREHSSRAVSVPTRLLKLERTKLDEIAADIRLLGMLVPK